MNRLHHLQLEESKLREYLGRRHQILESLTKQTLLLEGVSIKMDDAAIDIDVLQRSESYAQQVFKDLFEPAVTEALQFVFGPQYSFEMEFTPYDTTWRVNPLIRKDTPDGSFAADPRRMGGGGIARVLSTAMQIEFVRRWPEKIHGPLVFDECLAEIAVNARRNFLDYLRQAAESLDRSIVLITHTHEAFDYADRVYELRAK